MNDNIIFQCRYLLHNKLVRNPLKTSLFSPNLRTVKSMKTFNIKVTHLFPFVERGRSSLWILKICVLLKRTVMISFMMSFQITADPLSGISLRILMSMYKNNKRIMINHSKSIVKSSSNTPKGSIIITWSPQCKYHRLFFYFSILIGGFMIYSFYRRIDDLLARIQKFKTKKRNKKWNKKIMFKQIYGLFHKKRDLKSLSK